MCLFCVPISRKTSSRKLESPEESKFKIVEKVQSQDSQESQNSNRPSQESQKSKVKIVEKVYGSKAQSFRKINQSLARSLNMSMSRAPHRS